MQNNFSCCNLFLSSMSEPWEIVIFPHGASLLLFQDRDGIVEKEQQLSANVILFEPSCRPSVGESNIWKFYHLLGVGNKGSEHQNR